MKPAVKKRWIKALRSGKYAQTQKYLAQQISPRKSSYCCLGVLANEELEGDWILEEFFTVLGWKLSYGGQENSAVLPQVALQELGLSDNEAETLMSMNDHKGMNFYEIADWIEENL